MTSSAKAVCKLRIIIMENEDLKKDLNEIKTELEFLNANI